MIQSDMGAFLLSSLLLAGFILQAQTESEVHQRAAALLARMTVEEKIGQLNQLFMVPSLSSDSLTPEERVRKGGLGSFLFVTDPAAINKLQHIAVEESRLHIPLLFGFDVIHGFRTIFPVPLAMAASWDPGLAEQAQTVAAREASAAGVRWVFAPMVDIARDPRWGRIVEGAGEDPFLGMAMARAQVRGFQGERPGAPGHVLACVKHFAGYGAADGGRDYDSSYIPDDLLWNVYLPPFRAAVDAGAASLMSAYMDLNGVPATGNAFLLHDVLRRDWGFRGFVVSDAFAVRDLTTHGFAGDPAEAARRALGAGVDMDMGSLTYSKHLAGLVKDGRLDASVLDEAAGRILEAKIRLGLFESPFADEQLARSLPTAPEHRRLARVAAQRSAVLLRNENNLLPLDLKAGRISSIAVIGPLADSARDVRGPWALSDDAATAIGILQGIRGKVGASARVEYARGGEIRRGTPSIFDTVEKVAKSVPLTEAQNEAEFSAAVELARKSDIAVLALGELERMSGEQASRTSLDLPGRQQQLLEAVVALGKPVVLVLVNGRPLNIAWAAEHVPAILEAWYPGAEGGNAVADLLFGDATPGGKLPVTWPRSVGQVPIYYAHNMTHEPETGAHFVSRYWDSPSSPLYPFGYGLSYTRFVFSNLRLASSEVALGEPLEASADVENAGARPGDEVAQLYIHQRAGSASRPVRELKGFERISLARGEKKTVRFRLTKDELSFWTPRDKRWVEEPGVFDVWIGGDSNAALHSTFTVRPGGSAPDR